MTRLISSGKLKPCQIFSFNGLASGRIAVNAGAVHVIYGTPVVLGVSDGGLRSAGAQYWHQNRPGIKQVAQTDDFFGSSLTSGDFDGNGYYDLAIGVPDEDLMNGGLPVVDAGGVNVITNPVNAGHFLFTQGAQFQ